MTTEDPAQHRGAAAPTGTRRRSAGGSTRSQGEVTAKVLVSGTGPLVEPKIPDFPGLERFAGPDVPLRALGPRRRPEGQARGQRSAPAPRRSSTSPRSRPTSSSSTSSSARRRGSCRTARGRSRRVERRLFRARSRASSARVRGGIYAARELMVLGFVKQPKGMKLLEKVGRKHRERSLRRPRADREGDARLHRRLQAHPAVQRLVSGARARQRRAASPTASRRSASARSCSPAGASSRSTRWSSAPASTSSTCRSAGWCAAATAAAWPTPGTAARARTSARPSPASRTSSSCSARTPGLGHSSMVYMIESQIAYVMDALRAMSERGATSSRSGPRSRPRFHAEVQRRMQGTVWNTGCTSWYQDAKGNNPTLWPDWTWRFRQRTARFDPTEYVLAHESDVLITGAAGGIGSAAVAELRRQGAQVVGLDLRGRGHRLRRARPGVGRPRGGRGDRAPRRARRPDQQRRARHAAERGVAPDDGRAGGARRQPRRARGA